MYVSNKSSPSLCACTTVKKLSRVLGRIYDAALVESGINITQLGVLRCIDRRQGEPLIRVAEEMELDRTALYRALAPMIRNGWIVTTDAGLGNVKTARITPKGRRAMEKAGVGWDEMQQQLIASFGDSKYGQLVNELYRLASCAEEIETRR